MTPLWQIIDQLTVFGGLLGIVASVYTNLGNKRPCGDGDADNDIGNDVDNGFSDHCSNKRH